MTMIEGYGERWGALRLTVDEVMADQDGTLVEVTVHNETQEVSVQVLVRPGYYGAMIPWLAARLVTYDLAVDKSDRHRHVAHNIFRPDVMIPGPGAYLSAMDSVPELAAQASKLPDHFLIGFAVQMSEGDDDSDEWDASFASLHNSHKLIYEQGLPEAVEFMRNRTGRGILAARWPRGKGHYFKGFDWQTPAGRNALDIFMGMLNLRKPLNLEDIRAKSYPRREGPKEWSPNDMQSFILIKGRDYGRPNG